MISVGKLSDQNKSFLQPDSRAALTGHAAIDYFRACAVLHERRRQSAGDSFFFVLLPTMHQTLELASKAITFNAVPGFDAKKYSHRTLDVLNDFASVIPAFASIVAIPDNVDLIKSLETAYLGIRYGECWQSTDSDVWPRFEDIAAALFDDLSARTGLRFPMALD